MDFSNIVSAAQQAVGSIPGVGDLLGKFAGFGAIKDEIAQKLGVNPATLDEFENEVKTLLADGKISAEEMHAEISKLAAAKGIPQAAIDMVMGMLGGNAQH